MEYALLLVFSFVPFGQADSSGDARAFLEKLRSEKVDVREEAEKGLRSLGSKAIPALEQALRDPDVEVVSRAKYLLRVIPISASISLALREAMPGVEDRLAQGNPHTWCEVYAEAMGLLGRGNAPRTKDPRLQEGDLQCLILPAIEGARDWPERSSLIGSVAERKLRSTALGMLPLLKDPDDRVRAEVVDVFRSLKIEEASSDIRGLLKDRNSAVRKVAARALGRIGPPEVVPDLILLLRDPEAEVRESAVESLTSRKAEHTIAEMVPLLRDPDASVRRGTVEALRHFRHKESIPAVIQCLHDENALVRIEACFMLEELEAVEAAKDIAPLLDDTEGEVRSHALGAYAALGGKATAPAIRKKLGDPGSLIRRKAFIILYSWGDRESIPEMGKLLKSPDEDCRLLAASWLCWWGVKDGIPILFDADLDLNPLNGVRAPGESKRLMEMEFTLKAKETRRGLLERAAREGRLRLEWSNDSDSKDPAWAESTGARGDEKMNCLPAIKIATGSTPYEFVLGDQTLKILSREEAVKWWKAWWAEEGKR